MPSQLFSPSPARPAATLSRRLARWGAAALLAGAVIAPAMAQTTTLKIIPSSNITVLDPIWTTAYVTRNFGYMVYDTLFATDLEGHIKPADGRQVEGVAATTGPGPSRCATGLEFHDGKPVTSEDVVASHQALGQPRHLRRAARQGDRALATRPTPGPSPSC
jgi:peptide/nickel transport system substrate-binding protein